MAKLEYIEHQRLGSYVQVVADKEEIRHKRLAGTSGGECGWSMPEDFATVSSVAATSGSRILEIGSGDGAHVLLPALHRGAA